MSTILVFAAFGTAGLVGLTAVLYMFSFVGVPQTGVAARCLASYMALMACALIGVFSSLAMRLVGAEDSAQFVVARCFRWAMRLATGIVITVDDPHGTLQKTRPAVFIGNHQTELDVCMLGAVIPPHCSVTAKVSLRRIPILGWFMALSGTVFIDRKNSADARQAMAGAAETMRARRKSVYMFPEGTRSYSKEPVLLPFKKGAFHLAVQAQVPVVPVVVANYSHVLWVKGGVFKSGSIPCKGAFLDRWRRVMKPD